MSGYATEGANKNLSQELDVARVDVAADQNHGLEEPQGDRGRATHT